MAGIPTKNDLKANTKTVSIDLLNARLADAIDLALKHDPPVPIKTWWETKDGIAEFDTTIADQGDHVEVTILVPNAILDEKGRPDLANAKKLGLSEVTP